MTAKKQTAIPGIIGGLGPMRLIRIYPLVSERFLWIVRF